MPIDFSANQDSEEEEENMNQPVSNDPPYQGLYKEEFEELMREQAKQEDEYFRQLYEGNVKSEIEYRGTIIRAFLPIEDRCHLTLAEYFSKNPDKKIPFENLTVGRKIEELKKIINQSFIHFKSKEYPLVSNLVYLNKVRKAVSHYPAEYGPNLMEHISFVSRKDFYETSTFKADVTKCAETLQLLNKLRLEMKSS